MSTLKVTAKGQVTLRKDILEHLGVAPGDQLSVDKLSDGKLEVRAARSGDIEAVFGLLKKPNRPALTIAQMNDIAREGWFGKPRKK